MLTYANVYQGKKRSNLPLPWEALQPDCGFNPFQQNARKIGS